MLTRPVTVIDHGAGNIRSVLGAIEALGVSVTATRDPLEIESAKVLVLPGVGSFRSAMGRIRSSGIDQAIFQALGSDGSILGICLGMQLLCERSDEDGGTEGLALVRASVSKFIRSTTDGPLRIPHVGFNSVTAAPDSVLLANLPPHSDFYFVHSHRVTAVESSQSLHVATTPYGGEFVSVLESSGRVFGVQFHPELSQGNGLRLLWNYIECASC